jgi:hypothetical protein
MVLARIQNPNHGGTHMQIKGPSRTLPSVNCEYISSSGRLRKLGTTSRLVHSVELVVKFGEERPGTISRQAYTLGCFLISFEEDGGVRMS